MLSRTFVQRTLVLEDLPSLIPWGSKTFPGSFFLPQRKRDPRNEVGGSIESTASISSVLRAPMEINSMIDIFGQHHGRKLSLNMFLITWLCANFQLSYFSNDSSFIRWENGECLCLHPDFNRHLFGHCIIFSGKKVPPPTKSKGACKPMMKVISPVEQIIC